MCGEAAPARRCLTRLPNDPPRGHHPSCSAPDMAPHDPTPTRLEGLHHRRIRRHNALLLPANRLDACILRGQGGRSPKADTQLRQNPRIVSPTACPGSRSIHADTSRQERRSHNKRHKGLRCSWPRQNTIFGAPAVFRSCSRSRAPRSGIALAPHHCVSSQLYCGTRPLVGGQGPV